MRLLQSVKQQPASPSLVGRLFVMKSDHLRNLVGEILTVNNETNKATYRVHDSRYRIEAGPNRNYVVDLATLNGDELTLVPIRLGELLEVKVTLCPHEERVNRKYPEAIITAGP